MDLVLSRPNGPRVSIWPCWDGLAEREVQVAARLEEIVAGA